MKKSTASMLCELFDHYGELLSTAAEIERALVCMIDCYKANGKVLVCGNGGSASDSEHIVGELMKSFRIRRPVSVSIAEKLADMYGESGKSLFSRLQVGLPAISLVAQTSLTSAIANDIGSGMAYAQQVFGYGVKGDILIALSTSGNAENVLNAARVARAINMTVIGMTGMSGGKLARESDVCICVPEAETYRIQELHLPIYHCLCAAVENEFFAEER